MSDIFTVLEMSDYDANRRACNTILAQLPDWFGPRNSYQVYLDDLQNRPVFGVVANGEVVGIMAMTKTSTASADIHLIAVRPDHHGQGIGHALIGRAATFARNEGAVFLTVKTLGPSRSNAAYAKTIGFYERQGFLPVEEFADFWGDGYPMLLMCQKVS